MSLTWSKHAGNDPAAQAKAGWVATPRANPTRQGAVDSKHDGLQAPEWGCMAFEQAAMGHEKSQLAGDKRTTFKDYGFEHGSQKLSWAKQVFIQVRMTLDEAEQGTYSELGSRLLLAGLIVTSCLLRFREIKFLPKAT